MTEEASGDKIKVVVGLKERYSSDKIYEAFLKRPQYEVFSKKRAGKIDDRFAVQWLEYEDITFDYVFAHTEDVLCNSYLIRKGLIRKGQSAYCTHKFLSKHPDSILRKAIPETFLFELDDPYYFEEAMNDVFEVANDLRDNESVEDPTQTKKFILKPSITNKGEYVFVFDKEDQLRDFFERNYEDEETGELILSSIRQWVMQRYVDRPLLLFGGRKFHIRTYVLAISNLRVYVFEDMLALFSLKAYNNSDLSDTLSHITNTCVQATDEDGFVEENAVKLFWELDSEVGKPALDSIFSQIKDITGEVFRSVSGEVSFFQPRINCFELYGLDFIVGEDMQVYFLEANAFPDFKQTGAKLGGLISDLFDQTISLAIDPFCGVESPTEPTKMHLVLDKQTSIF